MAVIELRLCARNPVHAASTLGKTIFPGVDDYASQLFNSEFAALRCSRCICSQRQRLPAFVANISAAALRDVTTESNQYCDSQVSNTDPWIRRLRSNLQHDDLVSHRGIRTFFVSAPYTRHNAKPRVIT